MFYKFNFPVSKRQHIKNTLGFIAIILRKGLLAKKEDGSFYFEKEYILKTRDIIVKEFDHIVSRVNNCNNNKEVKDESRTNQIDS